MRSIEEILASPRLSVHPIITVHKPGGGGRGVYDNPNPRESKALAANVIHPLFSKVATVMFSWDDEWEHASLSFNRVLPTWEQMCVIKDIFWDGGEAVVQFHPRESEYVNFHKTCLHLWKYVPSKFPCPESWRV